MTRLLLAFLCVALLAACSRLPGTPGATPPPRYATSAVVVDGIVFVVGGSDRTHTGDRVVGTLQAYDPVSRGWSTCAPMPTPRAFAAAAVIDGKIYVFGGLNDDGTTLRTTESYDRRTNKWTSRAPMPEARSRHAAATRGIVDSIVVAGGLDGASANAEAVQVYSPQDDSWLYFGHLTPARHGLELIDASGGEERLIAIGGFDTDGLSARVNAWGVGTVKVRDENGELLTPVATEVDPVTRKRIVRDLDYQGYDWWPAASLNEPRGFFCAARLDRRIYVVGGRCPTIPRTEVLDLDTQAPTWTQAAPLPIDLCRFSMVAWNGRLLVFGGETDMGASINTTVYEYDPRADTWTTR